VTARHATVAIVGGGLSGLLAARGLAQQGVRNVVLLEARGVLGGRILSVDAAGHVVDPVVPGTDRFDLGPSWFWPGFQPQLDQLVSDLGLDRFEQFDEGDMVVERGLQAPPERVRADASEATSMRIVGSTGALIAAIQRQLDPGQIFTGQTVKRLRKVGAQVELDNENGAGEPILWRADHVLLALPPRLAARLDFAPPLSPALAQRWQATATWMAPQAKYLAIYERPFWRDDGLSGEARSACGPMVEMHDASMPGGHAALFGFLGVPARMRSTVTIDVLRAHCRAQLRRLFGDRAGTPLADALKDWASDALTTTPQDQDTTGQHGDAPPRSTDAGPWAGGVTGIGSEWSRQFPGYLAGAVDAAARGVRDAMAAVNQKAAAL
jgi:monoamine oxidase